MSFRPSAPAMNPPSHADLRFALGVVLAVAVLLVFVLTLHLLAA